MLAKSHQITSHRVNAEEYYFNPMGDVLYVKGGESATSVGNDSNDGKSPDRAFLTLAGAVDAANDWDKIIVLPSDNTSPYLEDDLPITITQTGLKIIGGLTSGHQWGTPAIHTHSTTNLIEIKAMQVEIAYLGFHQQGAGIILQIGPDPSAWWRTHIHDCYFGGNNTATYGAILGNVTGSGVASAQNIDAPCTILERCYFSFFTESCIYMNCGYGSVVRDCFLDIGTDESGIMYGNDTTSRPFGYITDNRFTTIDSTDSLGIEVVNSPTAGYAFFDGNRFNNFADDAHCITTVNGLAAVNYNCSSVITAVKV